MDNEIKKVKFSGTVERCIGKYKNDYKIYAFNVDIKKFKDIQLNKYNNVSVVGELPDLVSNIEYNIIAIEEVSQYGTSYKVLNITRNIPTKKEDVLLFLKEILTINQANVLYENYPDIIDRVKNNNLDDIDFSKLKGIKEYTFNVIKEKIIENFCLSDLVVKFQGYLTISMIKKIYNKYSSVELLQEKLKDDPYKCLCSLAGVSFKTADTLLNTISENNIINFDEPLKFSKERCLSAIHFILDENENQGNTQMDLIELRKKVYGLVPECADYFVDCLKDDSLYYNKNEMVAAKKSLYDIEYDIAKTILYALNNVSDKWDYDVTEFKMVNGFELSDEQLNACYNLCNNQISILNGAAGSGKSFSTQAIINMLKKYKKRYILMSPTGKAAKVLNEYTKEPACTIHRGLEFNPQFDYPWLINKNNKYTVDVIIIDEFSMVDIRLFQKVLDGIDFRKTKLLIIGDNAQLCAVGSGNILHDFMTSKIIPTTTLSKIFRYGEGGLMTVATDVRYCKTFLTKDMKNKVTTFGKNKDYSFIDMPDDKIPLYVVKLYKKLLSMGYNAGDIEVLTAKRIGKCGTVSLNNYIQMAVNKNCNTDQFIESKETKFYLGDIVIQEKNNYKAEVVDENEFSLDDKTAFISNGETGKIIKISNDYVHINFDGIIVKYNKSDLNALSLGYSITCHKSQGSGFKVIIFATPKEHTFMLNSNLLYVGLTRTKEKCFHIGSVVSVNSVIQKKANLSRNTFMQYLLKNIKKEEYENIYN